MPKKDEAQEIKPEDIKLDENTEQPPEGYSLEEWSDLSTEEKAGILDSINAPEGEEEPEPVLTAEQEAELAAIAESEKTPEQKAADEAVAETARVEALAKEQGKTVDEVIADEKKETPADVTDDALLSFRPTLTADEMPKVETLEEVIPPEIQAKFTELDAKFEGGDINQREYNDQRDKLNREIFKYNNDLEIKSHEALTEKKSELLWKKEQIHFLNAKPEYMATKAVDAAGKVKSNALFGALNEMVKSITSDPANASLTGMQVLIKADKAVKDAFGYKPAVPAKKKEEKPSAKIPDVKTLGSVPNAATNMDGVDDSFAQIDKLRGEDYENAIERMPEKVKDAYLARASR